MTKKRTAIFVVIATLFLICFDIFLAADGTGGNTYSEVIRAYGVRFAWLPYAVAAALAILVSHWFGKRDAEGDYTPKEKAFFVISMVGIMSIGLIIGLFW